MIYCPKCGTANRQGSRFCNECGTALPLHTGLRCPMCGAMNPVGNVHCDQCNARLIPLSTPEPPKEEELPGPPPIKGLSLPSIPLEETPPSREAPAEVPDWLAELRASAGEAEGEAPPAEEIERPHIPDWLAETRPAAAPPPFAGEEPLPERPVEVPDWLAEMEAARPEQPPAEEPAPERPVEVPDWLAEMEAARPEPKPSEKPPVAPVFISDEERPTVDTGATPDWLAELVEEERPAPPIVQARLPETQPLTVAPGEIEELLPAEIPDWLQELRPRADVEAPIEEHAETEGLLEGLRGTLLPSHAVEMPPGAETTPVTIEPNPAAVARAELLQELLRRPAPPPQPAARARWQRLGWAVQRVIVSLLLILAVIVPMIIPIPFFGTPSSPAADRLFEAIQQEIGADTPVLVAFEYGPADADEMNPVSEPILRHLLNQGARLVVVSTRPEGPAIAEMLLGGMIPEAGQRRQQVANLGYQPGGAAGIQDLLTHLDQRTEINTGMPAPQAEAMRDVHNAADVAMLIVLAAQPDDLRAWVEQASLTYPHLSLLAGGSARVEPLAAPYLDPSAGQLDGMVAGLAGAAAYEARLGTGGRASFHLASLGIAQLGVTALMMAGMVIFLLLGGRRK